ncbi:MAG: hypothetical protein OSA99_11255 [Acidimicrobiales bacterium]|nr:hypothetical protein [Acidimicrobiales bacterium]
MRVARPILGVVLVAMALGQASNLSAFVEIVGTYDLGGETIARISSAALLIGELVGGVGLLARRRQAAPIAVIVAAAWTIVGVQAFARGLDVPNCGCFGTHLSQPLRWWVLVQDAEFVALAWWVRRRWPASTPDPRPADDLAVAQ